MVPLYLEEKLIGGVFDLVLSVSVSHTISGRSLDGQDDVSWTQVDPRCLTAWCHLETRTRLDAFFCHIYSFLHKYIKNGMHTQ